MSSFPFGRLAVLLCAPLMLPATACAAPTTPEIRWLVISPIGGRQSLGSTVDYRATAIARDGRRIDVSAEVEWAVADDRIATVSNRSGEPGRITARTLGETIVRASYVTRVATSTDSEALMATDFRPALQPIPPGQFIMGISPGEPGFTPNPFHMHSLAAAHPVELTRWYLMADSEVTQAQYAALMGTNPARYQGADDDGARPVEMVSWMDAARYCNALSMKEGLALAYTFDGDEVMWDQSALGYRLPTEAEWEYAARAGEATPALESVAWTRANSEFNHPALGDRSTQPVKLKAPNGWGLYDMLGNVAEVTWDWHGSRYYEGYITPRAPVVDPTGPPPTIHPWIQKAHRVLRGESFSTSPDERVSVARRSMIAPKLGYLTVGFRPVRFATPASLEKVSARPRRLVASARLHVVPPRVVSLRFERVPTNLSFGGDAPVSVTATFDDDRAVDVTEQVSWVVTDPSIVRVDGRVVTGLLNGKTQIRATLDSVRSAPVTVTVGPPGVHGIAIFPSERSTRTGPPPFEVIALYDDGREEDVTHKALMTQGRLVDGYGATLTRATYGGHKATARLVVTPREITSVLVVPIDGRPLERRLTPGTTRAYAAAATLSNGEVRDVTNEAVWTVSSKDVATVSNRPGERGRVTALGVGRTTVRATYRGWVSPPAAAIVVRDLDTPNPSFESLAVFRPMMRSITPGTFTMGRPATDADRYGLDRQHTVRLSHGFLMAETEVTQAQFWALMRYNPSEFRDLPNDAERPVERVSWFEAVRYCNALSVWEGLTPAYQIVGTEVTWDRTSTGYRLPTEAEWEYVARTGADGLELDDIVWHRGNSATQKKRQRLTFSGWRAKFEYSTHPVYTSGSDAWGLYDIRGNVSEWMWDWHDAYRPAPDGAARLDPVGPRRGAKRVVRGGTYTHEASKLQPGLRVSIEPGLRVRGLGFRPVRFPVAPPRFDDPDRILDEPTKIGPTPRAAPLPPTELRPGMLPIAPGVFTMGTLPDVHRRLGDETRHRVELTRAILMAETEVTQAQYAAVTGRNPSWFQGGEGDSERPVESVSWLDAVEYCNALSAREGLRPAYVIEDGAVRWDHEAGGYRLPTEAEWEYAARPKPTATPHRSVWPEAWLLSWADSKHPKAHGIPTSMTSRSSPLSTFPVRLSAPNAWGLYDMRGNVWEWTWDWYGLYAPAAGAVVLDPEGPPDGEWRVLRGCSYQCSSVSAQVGRRSTGAFPREIGFRPVRDAR